MPLDFRSLWSQATPYHAFVRDAVTNRELWKSMDRIVHIPEWAITAVRSAGEKFNLLVLAEDWCGDGSSTIPYLAKLATLTRSIEVRVLRRDEHPAVMDRYLTDGARAIPIVIVLNRQLEELGHWGPRPADLQAWVRNERAKTGMKPPYPQIRRWYARDKGESALREVLGLFEKRKDAIGYQLSAVG
ncbi:MAG TPA: thioredoxin family protein [Gemmatimonadales bacterium]|nr:thioredoxin family protein [Gemmatimonadales bacterium]